MGSGRYGWACFAVHQAVAKALKARSLPGWNPRLATALRNDSRWLTGTSGSHLSLRGIQALQYPGVAVSGLGSA
jgi:hypothetical protein